MLVLSAGVSRQTESRKLGSQREWAASGGGSLSYHGVGAQPSVSRAHLLYLRHQGLEQGVGGGRGGTGGGDVFVGGGAPHALLAALRGDGAGAALLEHTETHTQYNTTTNMYLVKENIYTFRDCNIMFWDSEYIFRKH